MERKLNPEQLEYVLFHLNHRIRLKNSIRERMVFGEDAQEHKGKIIFPLSDHTPDEGFRLEGIPVLFPIEKKASWFKMDKQRNLMFHHDLLKSAFYLLSGYQEYKASATDDLGRYPFKESLQYRLNITGIPLVNHYFEILARGISLFCEEHGISSEKRTIWNDAGFGFMLTHDVDRVDKWTTTLVRLRMKQLLGFKRSNHRPAVLFRLLLKAMIKRVTRDNPYWNFNWMREIEQKFGFTSAWFFLNQGVRHIDAYYSLNEPRMVRLIHSLREEHEVGLHASYGSMNDSVVMLKDLEKLEGVVGRRPRGVRQHWLRFCYPETLRIQEWLGLKYDSSWMFAERLGWRNSYCLPFRPFDIERNRMMNIWEIPLCYMDNTPFKYQKLNIAETRESMKELLLQVLKYRGLFVMLWHNNYFDEDELPGLRGLYLDILSEIHNHRPETVLPSALTKRFDGFSQR